ncbi:hypothetical protein NOVO_00080 [Rickettsiales bacterium Ac37b]|nr:hypothetical protein NOVO_00080 [Rickettsiales bacterium Ac37b]
MLNLPILSTIALSPYFISSASAAIGYFFSPVGRATKCELDWRAREKAGSANKTPNSACEEAFKSNGNIPFFWMGHYRATTPSDPTDLGGVKAVFADGNICSAAHVDKKGMNIKSPDWYKNPITINEKGIFNTTVNMCVHADMKPNYFQAFLSKEDYIVN